MRRRRAIGRVALAVSALAASALAAAAAPPAVARLPLRPLGADQLCVTRGPLVDGPLGLRLAAPVVRAVAPGSTGDAAELAFTYLGPTDASVRLGSGQLRRQLGLKLRAADGCNLVYVMWRLEPRPGLEVSVKRNPGQRAHAACGTRGYRKVAATWSAPMPELLPGDRHALGAAIEGERLVVTLDGVAVWRGGLGADVGDLVGPAGLRSDNVAADVELRAATRRPFVRGLFAPRARCDAAHDDG